ncbi:MULTISPECIES: CdaR family protein [Bacillus]|uniref:CdaR family protein n=1 Tax=Bacillus TaxID=1386 RepID=UPI0002EC91A0|nr:MULTISPECIES: CdaR family protein [Bacillus]
MDKFIETPWFLKVVALSLAALLYISVNFEAKSDSSIFNTPSTKGTEVVESVPVDVYYDRDNLVVTGVPKTVDVVLNGPKNLVIPAKNSRDFKVYIDLSDPEIELGDKKVPIKIKDLSEKISSSIQPAYAEVSIQEKVTKEFSVQPEFDRALLEDGFIAEEPTVKPKKVKITGGKDSIEKIAYVKAIVNIDVGANSNVVRQAQVQALDRDLNKLDVNINPSTVEVEVPIKSPSKKMKIIPVASGKPKEGINITSINANPYEVTLYGKKSILDSIDELQVPVDVSKIEKDSTFTVAIDLPDGITAASVQEVEVKVSVSKDEQTNADNENNEEEAADISKTFSNLGINYIGLDEGYELAFINPSKGSTNVVVTGDKSVINTLTASDIQLVLNVKGLTEGEHTETLQIKAPNNVKVEASDTVAKFSITKNDVGT